MKYQIALALILFSIPVQAATVYIPQIADSSGYTTTLTVFNPGMSSINGILRFFTQM